MNNNDNDKKFIPPPYPKWNKVNIAQSTTKTVHVQCTIQLFNLSKLLVFLFSKLFDTFC